MKVEINETYVKCDICGEKIDHRIFYSHIHQMKVKKKVERKGLKCWYEIDMCHACYDKFARQIRKELKDAKKKGEENEENSSSVFN